MGRLHWAHVACTDALTHLSVHERRGRAAPFVFARTGADGAGGISALIVPGDAAGVSFPASLVEQAALSAIFE